MLVPQEDNSLPLVSILSFTCQAGIRIVSTHCPTEEGVCAAAVRVQHPSSTNSKARNFRRFTLGGSCGCQTTFGSSHYHYWNKASFPHCYRREPDRYTVCYLSG